MSKDPKLTQLQKYWRSALRKAGFRDIEDEHGRLIDHQSVLDFQQRIGFREDSFRAIRDYYIWAEQMNTLGSFGCRRDAKIWRLHSEGKSTREIGKLINLHWTLVARMIKRIRAELMLLQSTDWED